MRAFRVKISSKAQSLSVSVMTAGGELPALCILELAQLIAIPALNLAFATLNRALKAQKMIASVAVSVSQATPVIGAGTMSERAILMTAGSA
jgi:hypothetical protein